MFYSHTLRCFIIDEFEISDYVLNYWSVDSTCWLKVRIPTIGLDGVEE